LLQKCRSSIARSEDSYRVLTMITSTELINITNNFNLKWVIRFWNISGNKGSLGEHITS
jgi:hypothetical protein